VRAVVVSGGAAAVSWLMSRSFLPPGWREQEQVSSPPAAISHAGWLESLAARYGP
jgi:hypothetical protein